VVGVEVGARTGIAAIVGSLGFLLTIFFNPLLSSVPPWATGKHWRWCICVVVVLALPFPP
jgi:xanthine/uracil/vitamin C permease (AzgA family)